VNYSKDGRIDWFANVYDKLVVCRDGLEDRLVVHQVYAKFGERIAFLCNKLKTRWIEWLIESAILCRIACVAGGWTEYWLIVFVGGWRDDEYRLIILIGRWRILLECEEY
jgi:hypothetical protein